MNKDDIYQKIRNSNITYNDLNTLSYKQTKSIFIFITLNFNIYIIALCYDGTFSFQCYQNQTFTGVLQNRCSYKFYKISKKNLCRSVFLIKLQVPRLQGRSFQKKSLKENCCVAASMFPIRHVFQNIETFYFD